MTLRHKARADYMVFVVKNGRPQGNPQWDWPKAFELHRAEVGISSSGRLAVVPEGVDHAGQLGADY